MKWTQVDSERFLDAYVSVGHKKVRQDALKEFCPDGLYRKFLSFCCTSPTRRDVAAAKSNAVCVYCKSKFKNHNSNLCLDCKGTAAARKHADMLRGNSVSNSCAARSAEERRNIGRKISLGHSRRSEQAKTLTSIRMRIAKANRSDEDRSLSLFRLRQSLSSRSEEDRKRVRDNMKRGHARTPEYIKQKMREAVSLATRNRTEEMRRSVAKAASDWYASLTYEEKLERSNKLKTTLARRSPEEWAAIQAKKEKSGVTYKTYTTRAGDTLKVQGYEPLVLSYLEDIGAVDLSRPSFGIPYSRSGDHRTYLPDILCTLKRRRYLVEVKSTWTLGPRGSLRRKVNYAKFKSATAYCHLRGWSFVVAVVYSKNGERRIHFTNNPSWSAFRRFP